MIDKCPVCNHDLIAFTEGSTTGVRCSYCDYSLVTTYIEPIYEDENTYTITLEAGNTADQQTIKAISKITGENYIFAKRCLENTPIEIVKGSAAEIIELKKSLDLCGIKYSITPEFPY